MECTRDKMESERKNTSKWVTNHDQIEGKIQNSKQPKEEMQHKTPEKSLGKIEKTSKDGWNEIANGAEGPLRSGASLC